MSRENHRSFNRVKEVYREKIYRNFKLRCELKIHEQTAPKYKALSGHVKVRSRIHEITHGEDIIFVLTHAGLCVAFDRASGERLCYVNHKPDEVARSMFYNSRRRALLLISVYLTDSLMELRCRAIPIDDVRAGRTAGAPLFSDLSLKWPGFVEFDDVNGKILTLSNGPPKYTVWSLESYEPLFWLPASSIFEIKTSPGLLLVLFQRTPSLIPLKVLDIETGETLYARTHLLNRRKKLELMELFCQKIFIKQEADSLQIIDIYSGDMRILPPGAFLTPKTSMFLPQKHIFLTFREGLVEVWNTEGDKMHSFSDHSLHSSGNKYVGSENDTIFSYCHDGTIKISCIMTGKCLGVISPDSIQDSSSTFSPLAEFALDQVSCISFNERTHELYVGNDSGYIYILR